jgi:hypothetical protein
VNKNTARIIYWIPFLFIACQTVDGTDPYATWKTYSSSDELFHFHYLSPPWEKDSREGESYPLFVVDTDDDPLPERGMPGDGIGARLSLELAVEWQITALELAQEDLGNWEANGADVEPYQTVENRAGDEGIQVYARASDRWITAVYFSLAEDGVVAMKMAGKHDDLSSDDISLLLDGLEPRPANGN